MKNGKLKIKILTRFARDTYAFGVILLLLTAFCFLLTSQAEAKWQTDERLTNASGVSEHPQILASGKDLHVVWADSREGDMEIYYKRRSLKGRVPTWSEDVRLTFASGTSYDPKIAINQDGMHVVWFDNRDGRYQVYYKSCSLNLDPTKSENWTADINLSNTSQDAKYPGLATSQDSLSLVWEEGGEIYFKHYRAGVWGSAVKLTSTGGKTYNPDIAIDQRGIHIVWFDNREGTYKIYYKMCPAGSDPEVLSSWSQDLRLSDVNSVAYNPAINAFDSGLQVVWEDSREGNRKIYYKRCKADLDPTNILKWSNDIKLIYEEGIAYHPALASDDNGIHIVFEDNREGDYKIFYKMLPGTRNGSKIENWSPDVKISDTPSEYPALTTSDSGIYIAWGDSRNGNSEIYLKENDMKELTLLNARVGGVLVRDLLILLTILLF